MTSDLHVQPDTDAPGLTDLSGLAADDRSLVVGLGPLVKRARRLAGGTLDGTIGRTVSRLVSDRYSVTVSSTGVEARGLIRRHRVRWADAEVVLLEPLAAMATRRVIGRTSRSMVGRAIPVPVVRGVAQSLVDRVADAGADLAAGLPIGLPAVLVEVRDHRGDGVTLDGPLALTALLCRSLTRGAVAEAGLHDVPVRTSTAS